MATHELKCWPQYFQAVKDGDKTFEVRVGNDRKYERGDWIILREWEPKVGMYTQREMAVRVSFVLHGKPFLPRNMWVFGIYTPK